MKLTDLTWPEAARLDRKIVLLYPIAALEQHSRHLPFFTDSILCGTVAERVEAALPREVLLLPLQWLGASAHHLGMAGSLSAELDTHGKLIAEPLRCLLQHGFSRVLVLNGHGGNIDTYHLALRQLALEFPNAKLCGASYWELADREIAALLLGPRKSVGHACEMETAMMLATRPDLVRRHQIINDLQPEARALRGIYIPLDMKRQTQHGGIGYARFANANTGRKLLQVIVSRVIEVVRAIRAETSQTPKPKSRRKPKLQ